MITNSNMIANILRRMAVILPCSIILYLILIIWLPLPGHKEIFLEIEHEYNVITYETIANRLKPGTHSDEEWSLRLLDYVHRNVFIPSNATVIDQEPLDMLARGIGWCDQQANLLMYIAARAGMDARLIFLKLASGVSPHSVTEIMNDDAWRVFDPYCGITFRNPYTGQLATRQDLIAQPYLITQHPKAVAITQVSGGIPSHVFTSMPGQYIHEPRIFVMKEGRQKPWLFNLPAPLRETLLSSLQNIYLTMKLQAVEDITTRQYVKARHYHFWDKYEKARRGYEAITLSDAASPVLEPSMFFYGLLEFERGAYENSITQWQTLVERFPNGAWLLTTHSLLGEAYLAIGETEEAKVHLLQGDPANPLLDTALHLASL